jgi:hypothetical protein
MANLVRWSTKNKLVINLLKTKEMVIHRPSPRLFIPPFLSDDIEKVCFQVVGCYFMYRTDLWFGEHISEGFATCRLINVCI